MAALKDKYNSGLFIRSGRKVGANQINLAKGGEGGFIGGKIKGAKTVPDLQKSAKEWNEWRVLAQGDKVTFWCNGKMAWEATGLKPAKGYIGLQAEGARWSSANCTFVRSRSDSAVERRFAGPRGSANRRSTLERRPREVPPSLLFRARIDIVFGQFLLELVLVLQLLFKTIHLRFERLDRLGISRIGVDVLQLAAGLFADRTTPIDRSC